MSDHRPIMHVTPATYRGRPALVIHSTDANMDEAVWDSFLARVLRDAQRVGAEQLWPHARRDGLQWAYTSTIDEFRLPMQYPRGFDPEQAVARLVAFAPEFDWLVEADDTSRRSK